MCEPVPGVSNKLKFVCLCDAEEEFSVIFLSASNSSDPVPLSLQSCTNIFVELVELVVYLINDLIVILFVALPGVIETVKPLAGFAFKVAPVTAAVVVSLSVCRFETECPNAPGWNLLLLVFQINTWSFVINSCYLDLLVVVARSWS